MTSNLQDSLLEQKQQTKQEVQQIPGILGIPLNGQRLVEVPNRNAYLYVRLRNNQSEVIQAYNNKVSPAYNLPVLVERQGNRYVVVSIDTQRYENNWNSFAPFLPRHGNTHSFDIESGGGGDIVWVYPRQFIPAMVMPSGSLGAGSVFVNAYTLKKDNNTWIYTGNTGTPSLLTYRPSSPTGAVMALVYLDTDTGNPGLLINSGTVFSNSITGSNQIVPYIPSITNPSTQVPLAAIRLITGTNAISWDNIYDVRQFVHNIPTGTGGGSASINTGTLNSLYLRLDATNDPVTPVNGSLSVYQEFEGGNTSSNPLLDLNRYGNDGLGNIFNGYAFELYDEDTNAQFNGGTLHHTLNDVQTLVDINPYRQTTGTVALFDSVNQISPDGRLLSLKNQEVEKFYVNGSGTAYSNDVPLVKEAPVDGNQYARKNAGWEEVSASASGDWNIFPGTLAWKGSDSPTFNVDATGNVTGTIAVGAKIQLTHYIPKYFVVTSIGTPSGTVTPMTLYGGTDYALGASGTITSPQYSHLKSPIGFPLRSDKWTVSFTDTTQRTQASPVQNTWYNPGSLSFDIPIGAWNISWKGLIQMLDTNSGGGTVQGSLSTANNSESDTDLTAEGNVQFTGPSTSNYVATVQISKVLVLESKTTYYPILRTRTASQDNIYYRNDIVPYLAKIVCAYL